MKLIAFLFKKLIINIRNTFKPNEDGGYSEAQLGLVFGLVIIGVLCFLMVIKLISKI